jgi:hypothetical protein
MSISKMIKASRKGKLTWWLDAHRRYFARQATREWSAGGSVSATRRITARANKFPDGLGAPGPRSGRGRSGRLRRASASCIAACGNRAFMDPSPPSLPRVCRLILGIDQGDLERRRPFSRGTSGSNPSSSATESVAACRMTISGAVRPPTKRGTAADRQSSTPTSQAPRYATEPAATCAIALTPSTGRQ